ncbi:MAG: four-carbon acid sugar kinase family protein [Janthinobacterium lividum]
MPDTVIIADDLSGAADCGIACAAAGLETIVVLGERPDEPACRVLSVDADTRGRTRGEAAAETARLVRLHAPPSRLVFRKLDSTLRGHVAAELAAVLAVRREAGRAAVLLAPAFPATGRTTRDGVQLLDGVALQDTAVWRRERMAGTAFLPAMLAQAGLRAVVVGLGQVRADGLGALVARLAADPDVDVLACDAETDDDLARIAAAGFGLGPSLVWAGSAGLAAGLARLLPRAAHAAASPAAGALEGPVLFVVGSLSAVSARQVAALAALPGVEPLVVASGVLRQGEGSAAWRDAEDTLERALGSGRDVVVSLAAEPDADPREGLALCHALARLAAPHAGRIGALVSAGGETARAVLLAFGATGLRLRGEIEPGVPLSLTEGGRAMPVVTKAGAFGRDDTLLRCRAVLHAVAPGRQESMGSAQTRKGSEDPLIPLLK